MSSALRVWAARSSLLRTVRTDGSGQLAPGAERTVRTLYAYQPRAHRTQVLHLLGQQDCNPPGLAAVPEEGFASPLAAEVAMTVGVASTGAEAAAAAAKAQQVHAAASHPYPDLEPDLEPDLDPTPILTLALPP